MSLVCGLLLSDLVPKLVYFCVLLENLLLQFLVERQILLFFARKMFFFLFFFGNYLFLKLDLLFKLLPFILELDRPLFIFPLGQLDPEILILELKVIQVFIVLLFDKTVIFL